MYRTSYNDMSKRNTTVLEYLVTALIKLVPKLPNHTERIRALLQKYETHISPELQQRACEYQELMKAAAFEIRAMDDTDLLETPAQKIISLLREIQNKYLATN